MHCWSPPKTETTCLLNCISGNTCVCAFLVAVMRGVCECVCPYTWTYVCMRVLVCALSGVRQGAVAVGLVYVVRGLKVRGEGGGAWVRSGASSLQHHSATWRMAEGMRMLSLHLNLFSPLSFSFSVLYIYSKDICAGLRTACANFLCTKNIFISCRKVDDTYKPERLFPKSVLDNVLEREGI